MTEATVRIRCFVGAALLAILVVGGVALAQPFPPPADAGQVPTGGQTETGTTAHALVELKSALVALPLATLLGAALAFRPLRRGTPPRDPAVIQTQIILAIVGAVVMLVVGANVARAFAVVGAAGLVRYRAKIQDPKDAGVMLCALAIGLGTGVGLYALAAFSTAFMMLVVSIIESLQPPVQKSFTLHVKTKDPAAIRPALERLLQRYRIGYELRTSAQDELSYSVELPFERRTDRLSTAIQELDPSGATSVEWDENKKGK
jgi:uncharacterized membrane protein YhiD involved in acid resistance